MAMLAAVNAVITVYIGPVNKLLTSLGGRLQPRQRPEFIWFTVCWPITSSASRVRPC